MASKIPGYKGTLLDIDLTARTVKKVDLDPQLAKDYIGGRGMGAKILMDTYGANYAKIDPLSPDALLLFLAGPLVNFIGGKTNVVFKSPQTNGIVAAQGSGDWIHELRFAGYDGVILRGKASSPVYITIFDDKVEIKDASKVWGKNITDTHKFFTDQYGNYISQYYIGPAGENLVRYACVMTEWYRAAGRGGGGAVMGSKNLKALICRGTGPAPDVADQTKINSLMEAYRKTGSAMAGSFHEYGTTSIVYSEGAVTSGEPVKNWQTEWHDQVSVRAEMFAAEQWVRRYWADYGCVVACSKLGRVKAGKRAGLINELPDYEAGALNGTNWGIFDISEMAYATSKPDELGLDLISVGNVLGWACEAQEKGILTAADLGGVQLKWGDADGFGKLMDMIATRQGGETIKLLGEGLLPTVKKIGKGSEQFAVMVRGLEVGAHGARSGKDQTEMSYPVSIHGGDHVSTASPTGEGTIWTDSTGICLFHFFLSQDQQLEWLNASTGFGVTKDTYASTYLPRMTTLLRVSLLLSGWTYKDDVNPPRFYEPLPEGPFKGSKVDKTIEETKKQAYYKTMGWDSQGVPTAATLEKFGFSAYESLMAPLRAKT